MKYEQVGRMLPISETAFEHAAGVLGITMSADATLAGLTRISQYLEVHYSLKEAPLAALRKLGTGSGKAFFYIGAIVHGAADGVNHEGFEAASTYFHTTLKPAGDWYYLLEYSADNAAKQVQPTNMCFRVFAPWADKVKEGMWNPPGRLNWVPPAHLGRPFTASGQPRSWELICSAIKKTAKKVDQAYTISRTGRADVNVVKTTGGTFTLDPGLTTPKSDCSGRVLKSEYDELVDVLKPVLPFPMFSVSDCNTFHTTGYLWGKLALDRSLAINPTGGVLVVDIDQHTDAGSVGTVVSSDGWGHPLIGSYSDSAYVVLGQAVADADSANVYSAIRVGSGNVAVANGRKALRMGAGTQYQTDICPKLLKNGSPEELRAALGKLWDDLEGFLGTKFKHLYITVDRDSMFGSRTQWGDTAVTFETPAEILKVLDAIVETTANRGARFAGFDVTGIPDAEPSQLGVQSRLLGKSDTRTRAQVAQDLAAEIAAYGAWFDGWTTLK